MQVSQARPAFSGMVRLLISFHITFNVSDARVDVDRRRFMAVGMELLFLLLVPARHVDGHSHRKPAERHRMTLRSCLSSRRSCAIASSSRAWLILIFFPGNRATGVMCCVESVRPPSGMMPLASASSEASRLIGFRIFWLLGLGGRERVYRKTKEKRL